MQQHLKDAEETAPQYVSVGNYLAGFAFEKSGSRDEAVRFYDEALLHGHYDSLAQVLPQLLRGYTGIAPHASKMRAAADAAMDPAQGEILVIIGSGRVPPKIPKRIPIGLALTLMADSISPHDRSAANALAAKGLVTWLNYPTLGQSRGAFARPSVLVDGAAVPVEEAMAVEASVRKIWLEAESTVMLAAFTRMLTRAVAGEVMQGATQAAAGRDGGPLGLLVGLATSAALTAADTPDTRSWSTLPARIDVARVPVPAGKHTVAMSTRGQTRTVALEIPPGWWRTTSMFVLR